ncbi:uncharacterized protein LOC121977580 [Zingiber officinale]|uniref:Uncharacterized protein n=1 Tax=Zingiber officinale TaxID=94328 RepID=A0A8J5LPW4_ZINOF|nr:uncharacterized protein LOC121977580 [Zingiber officinale]KAG6533365.1 hypothetical protein ZIOFF_007232 [Zingiber officinale]
MRGLFEKSKEVDVRLLLSKLGFAVSLPIAGYLVVNSNQASSSSSASSEAGVAGKSVIRASSVAGRNFKDELHIQESEGVLANIIHGTSDITNSTMAISAIKGTSANIIKSWVEEGCHLPPVKQFPLYRDSIIKRLTYTESEAKKVEMEQKIAEIQEHEKCRCRDCCILNNQQNLMTEIEEQLKINIYKAKYLYIKIYHLRIWNPDYWEMIREFESVIIVVDCLIRALKSDWWHLSHKMAALEPKRITMMDNKIEDKQQGDAKIEDRSKTVEIKNEKTKLRNSTMSSESKIVKLVDKLEVTENLAAANCSPNNLENDEDLVANCLVEANREEMENVQLSYDHDAEFALASGCQICYNDAEFANMVQSGQINTLFECEQWNSAASSEKTTEISSSELVHSSREEARRDGNSTCRFQHWAEEQVLE